MSTETFPLLAIDVSKSYNCHISRQKLKKIPIKKSRMTHTARMVIDRLITEFDNYFPNPDSDQLLAMKLHPLMDYSGFR